MKCEIKATMVMMKETFTKEKETLSRVEKRLIKYFMESFMLLYGTETWTLRKTDEMEAFKMLTWTKMEKMCWAQMRMISREKTMRGEIKCLEYLLRRDRCRWGHGWRQNGRRRTCIQLLDGIKEDRMLRDKKKCKKALLSLKDPPFSVNELLMNIVVFH